MENQNSDVEELVHARYSQIAKLWTKNQPVSCCGGNTENNQYSLGCDRRLLEIAAPQTGEVVIDFGSGAGIETQQIAELVTPGEVYGIDFSENMINMARDKSSYIENISFIHSHLSDIPLDNNKADLIVSNCVFNLVEDKQAVFNEAYRLLKPRGRLVISDMITDPNSPKATSKDICSCIGGARSVEAYIDMMEETGFVNTESITEYENTYESQNGTIFYESVIFIGYKKS